MDVSKQPKGWLKVLTQEEFNASNIWVHQEFFKDRKYLWKKRIYPERKLQNNLNLSKVEKKLFNIIFELLHELIKISELDYSKKLFDYEAKYLKFSDKISIFTFKKYINFRFKKMILKTILILNKYLEKILLT